MFHVYSDLVGTSCLEDTFYHCHVPQTFDHFVMGHSMFALFRVIENGHLKTVFRVAPYIAFNSAFVVIDDAPYQCYITAMGGLMKKLIAQIGLCISSLCYDEQAGCIFVYTMYQPYM